MSLSNTLAAALNELAKPGYKIQVMDDTYNATKIITIYHHPTNRFQRLHITLGFIHRSTANSHQLLNELIEFISWQSDCLDIKPKFWTLFKKHMTQILDGNVIRGQLWA